MTAHAPTVLDYLDTDFAPFSDDAPFNPLDACVFAELAMVRAEGFASCPCHLRDLMHAERYPEMFSGFIAADLRRAFLAAAASPRFRDLEVLDVTGVTDEGAQTQFAALAMSCPGRFTVVSYRGTDGTITGWREDCNMAFTWPVPGQAQAQSYLERMAERTRGPLYVCGHSKGGNLALYAAVKVPAEVRSRIAAVYDLDGPGFRPQAFSDEEYARVRDRLVKVIPRDSVVGLVLETRGDWRVVPSSNVAVMQHDAFSWQADLARRDFAYLDEPSQGALYFKGVVDEWLAGYSDDELRLFVNTLFDSLRHMAGSDSMAQVFGEGKNPFAVLSDAARKADGDGKALAMRMVGQLTGIATKAAGRTMADSVGDFLQDTVQGLTDRLPLQAAQRDDAHQQRGDASHRKDDARQLPDADSERDAEESVQNAAPTPRRPLP